MHAIDDLSDAIDVTREFLTPVEASTWLKLAFVIFFISSLGLAGPPTPPGDMTMAEDPFVGTDFEGEITVDLTGEELLTYALILGAIALSLWILFALVGAIMEFVLLESLRSMTVRIRRYGRRNLSRAMHVFGLRLLFGLGGVALVGLPTLDALRGAESLGDVSFGTLAVVGLAGFAYVLFYTLVMRLTTDFVAPVMLMERRGILSGWRRFWSTFIGSLSEYVVYAVLVTILQFVLGIAIGFVVLLTGLVIGIPVIILAILSVGLAGSIGLVLAGAIVVAGGVLFVVLLALIQVPVVTYVRYYALLVLGDTNPDLDLIPTHRAMVRTTNDGYSSRRGSGGDDGRDGSEWDDGDGGGNRTSSWRTDAGWDSRNGTWDDDGDDDGSSNWDDDDDESGWR